MEEEHSSSMVNKDVQDRSLILFAPFVSGPHCATFFKVQLEQQGDDDVKGGGSVTRETPVLKPLLKFFDDPEQSYLCTAARIFSHSKVYVLLEDVHRPRPLEADTITNTNTPREGYAFDLKTGSFDKFASSKSIKPLGTVLSAHGQLYYIASPWGFPWIPEASFERYDPAHDKWDTLPSFPYYSYHLDRTYITGYAVCYGWILFSMLDMSSLTVQLFGYHDKKNEWHPVKGSTGFFGRAVVVGETLYAVALSHNLVIAFSFGKCGGEDGPIAYTLSPSLPLKGLKTADPPSPFCERTSVCLVHLGGRDFCFVQTGQSEYLDDIQHIGVTMFEIVDDGEEGNPMINTLHSTFYAVDTSDLDIFDIDFGFATWLGDVEPEGEIVTLPIEQEETECKETSLEELNWGVADACQLTKGEVVSCSISLSMEEEHSSSMVNKDVQDRSLILFAPFVTGPHCAAFFKVQLEQQGDDDVKGGGSVTRETPVLKPLLKFFDDPEQSYLCTAARIFSHSKVYVLLEDGHRPRPLEADTITNTNTPREGYAFELKTGSFDKFASPKSIKPLGTVLSAHGQLYYIASPWGFPWIPEASFERYDPAHDKWDTLPSFPYYSYRLDRTYITGYAVCYGWILFSMLDMRSQTVQLFGYHDKRNEWHPVKGSTGFIGRAVVVGETLYAVALSHNLVIAFSFGKCGDEDGPIAYALSPSLPLKGLKAADSPSPFWDITSVCLVHLGGRDFCFVQTGQSEYLDDIQHIGVTRFEIVDDGEEGNPMINTFHSTVYAVDTSDLHTFDIDFGFATWLDEVEPEGEIMTLLIEQEETECKETSLEELNWGVADGCQLNEGEGEVKKKSGQGKGKKKSGQGKGKKKSRRGK